MRQTVLMLLVLLSSATCLMSGQVRVDATANGTQLEIEQGQVLVLVLESNPSTGYGWEIVDIDAAILEHLGEAEYEGTDPREPPPPGSGGEETFRFEAKGVGETALELVYRRSWETDEEPARTFAVRVVVR